MTVKELSDVINIDYLSRTGIRPERWNSYTQMKYAYWQVEEIEIDWENQEVIIWIKEPEDE